MITVRARKALVVALEIAGVALAVAAAAFGFLVWRLHQGPVSLALFKRSAEFAIERTLGKGRDARIGEAYVSLAPGGDVELRLESLTIAAEDGATLAELPFVEVDFASKRLLRGAIGPRRIVVVEPSLKIVRKSGGTIAFESGPANGRTFRLLTGAFARGAFESAELRDARAEFVDLPTGRSWTSSNAQGRIVRTKEGYVASLDGLFDTGGREGRLALQAHYTEKDESVAATMSVSEAPIGDVIEAFAGSDAAFVSAPFTGTASLVLTKSGEILSSRIDGEAGKGELRFAGRAYPLEFLRLAVGFDPQTNKFRVERAEFGGAGSMGSLTGDVELRLGENGSPKTVQANVDAADVVLDTHGFLPAPLAIPAASLKGGYDVAARRTTIEAFRAEVVDVVVSGALTLARAENGAIEELKGAVEVEGEFDPQRLLAVWPVDAGLGARDFLATRVPKARISGIAAKLDIDRPHPEQPLPDEALEVAFSVADATAYYAPTMTPLSEASASAVLRGNSLQVRNARGRIGDVAVSKGEIEFDKLAPKGAPVRFRFVAEGDASAVLAVLDEEPLRVLKTTDLKADQFSGKMTVLAEIARPNLREVSPDDYRYSAKASFEDLGVADFYKRRPITAGKGRVDLDEAIMRVFGDAEFAKTPIALEWTQRLKGTDRRGRFKVTGTLSGETAQAWGAQAGMLAGSVPFEAHAVGSIGAIETVSVDADLTAAALSAPAIGWTKSEGSAATAHADIEIANSAMSRLSLTADGQSLSIAGSAEFSADGRIQAADFGRLRFENGADLSVRGARAAGGALDVEVTGAFLNAAAMVQDAVERKERRPLDWGEGVTLRARLDRLSLRGGAAYRDVSLDFRRDSDMLSSLDVSARTEGGAPLSIALKETGADTGPARSVEARTDDLGQLLSGVFGVSSIRGGEGSMEIMLGAEGAPLTGVAEARGVRVVNAPLMARVLAAASFDGLAQLVNGKGIDLNQAYAEFDYQRGVLTIDEARMSGPSIGFTSSGTIAAGETGSVDLNGAIAPAYGVNSLLGRTPVVGPLFGRKGEGLLALSYQVRGTADDPNIMVNPLSALTPGIMRRMFEPRRKDQVKDETAALN
jgi:hypothetical protein